MHIVNLQHIDLINQFYISCSFRKWYNNAFHGFSSMKCTTSVFFGLLDTGKLQSAIFFNLLLELNRGILTALEPNPKHTKRLNIFGLVSQDSYQIMFVSWRIFLKNSRQFNCSGPTRDSWTTITKQTHSWGSFSEQHSVKNQTFKRVIFIHSTVIFIIFQHLLCEISYSGQY